MDAKCPTSSQSDTSTRKKGCGDSGSAAIPQTARILAPREHKTPSSPSTERRSVKTRNKALSTLEPVLEGDGRSPKHSTRMMATKKQSRELLKSNSQYFHAALNERSGDVVGDLVRGEAMVMAELKTNIKIEHEAAFITDLSQHLAKRYSRSVDSIIVTLDHGKCMLFGGTMDPAYTMSISALPLEVQKATNKRNTAVIQRYMETALGVPSTRGFIHFIAVSEECVGWGGKTVFGRIGDAGARTGPDADESRTHERRIRKPLSLRKSTPMEATPPSTPSKKNSVHRSASSSPTPTEKMGGDAQNGKTLRKRKSFMASFFRSAKYDNEFPAIPQGTGT